MIDLHCHLDLYSDPAQITATCKDRGIYVLSVTTTPSAWEGTARLAHGADRISTAVGLHPQLARARHAELEIFDRLLPLTRYVGEVGLDGAPEFQPHWDIQLAVFNHVLKACSNAGGRILSIHSRRATAAVLGRLQAYRDAGIPVLHWFSGSRRDLECAIDLGCWFSVGPAMLRSRNGRFLAALMPRDRVLTESDGPFAQDKGTPLMPWHVDRAVHILGELWSVSAAQAQQTIRRNLRALTMLVPDLRSAPR
ncbi:MAG: TatD family deoxyribonuclease [Gemmatimonadetes bacterium]|nr:TatD family deoxyribonuclease [Gemmatimonadota bacterium]MYI65337.1 TatD family deoxyribonuclease [Gemmatimonadota bacterium]